MLKRSELLTYFQPSPNTRSSLRFEIKSEVSNSRAIQSREVATAKSLKMPNLNQVANLEGSPSFEVISEMIKIISTQVATQKVSGLGVELGSGLGLLSMAFIKADRDASIQGILALEAGKPFIEGGIQQAANEVLGEFSHKILPCHGSFDSLPIEDGSIDFALQIEALHHAESLEPPLLETYRILKQGGIMISIDRSWPNSVSDKTLRDLIEHEYEKEWLAKKGFPSEMKFTRGDNGEHEYRDEDWQTAFLSAGFKCLEFKHLHPKFTVKQLIKRIICLTGMSRFVGIKIRSRKGTIRGFLYSQCHFSIRFKKKLIVTPHPRPLTVSVWAK